MTLPSNLATPYVVSFILQQDSEVMMEQDVEWVGAIEGLKGNH